MALLKGTWKSFISDESGATAIEYAMIAGAITLALVPSLPLIQENLQTKFSTLAAGLDGGS